MSIRKKKSEFNTDLVDLLLDDPDVTSVKDPTPEKVDSDSDLENHTSLSPFRSNHEISEVVGVNDLSDNFEANISRSEHLRLAQNKILELEDEVERLRVENEQFSSSNNAMKSELEDLAAKSVTLERKFREANDNHNDEKNHLKANMAAREKEAGHLKAKVEELESRLMGDLKKIRVRERELENRLELAKIEGSAVIRSKDEMILDLKRQLDQIANEMENYKGKAQELNQQIDESQDRTRRAVKALRLALSMLDGDESAVFPLKKVD